MKSNELKTYRTPRIEVLGNLSELTRGAGTVGGPGYGSDLFPD